MSRFLSKKLFINYIQYKHVIFVLWMRAFNVIEALQNRILHAVTKPKYNNYEWPLI